MPSVLDIALFGGLQVRGADGSVLELPGRKDRALLGFLAAAPGLPFPREKLAGLLWGESGERQARDSLKQALLRLRRALDAQAGALIATRPSVKLDPAAVSVDAQRFEALLKDGGTQALERALALYRGDLLEGVEVAECGYEDWLAVERQRLRGLATEAATALMARLQEEGQSARAAGAARLLLTLEPLHEAACRTLMRAHGERGERAQALKLFERLRERLDRELATTPEPATLELYGELRARSPALNGAQGNGGSETVFPERRAGQLRISAHPAFAARWLVPRLDRFRRARPDCEVVLDATPRLADFRRDGTDIAIRRGPGKWPGCAEDLLVASQVFPVAAPGLVAAARGKLPPEALADCVLLHDDDGCLWRSWFAAAGLTEITVEKGVRILESGLAIEAAVAGQGVALADHFLVAEDLAAGRLVKLCDHSVEDWDYYLISLARERPPAAAAFRDWLLRDTEALRNSA